MVDLYITHDLIKNQIAKVETPYRDYEFIEFYKIVKAKNEIIAISIDEDSHIVSLILGDPKKEI